MTTEILTGFDGNGPATMENVRREAEDRFTLLFPSVKEKKEDAKGARLGTRVRNSGATPQPVTVTVEMPGRPGHVANYDIAFIRHESDADWTMIPGRKQGDARVTYRFDARPGVTELAHCPAYNYESCVRFVDSLRGRDDVEVSSAGKSDAGHEMWLVRFASPNPDAFTLFVQARDHAYESAGSYCVEGMAAFLLSDDPICRYLREKFQIYLMPMTNPDGVAGGYFSMSAERDANLEFPNHDRKNNANEEVLRNTLDRLRPQVYINIHNFSFRFMDAILGDPQETLDRVIDLLPADAKHYKRWTTSAIKDFWERGRKVLNEKGYTDETSRPEEYWLWMDYARERYGATAVTFEFPWFGRTAADMRERGKQALIATALAAVDLRKL